MRLVLLRHAKSAWPDGVADDRRPLADRGRRDAPAVGRWLAGSVPDIDVALVSPATRARQTWELASAELPAAPPTRYEPRLYFAGPTAIRMAVRELPAAGTVLVVGHNPDLEELVQTLAGERVTLKTASVAVLSYEVGPDRAEVQLTLKIRG